MGCGVRGASHLSIDDDHDDDHDDGSGDVPGG